MRRVAVLALALAFAGCGGASSGGRATPESVDRAFAQHMVDQIVGVSQMAEDAVEGHATSRTVIRLGSDIIERDDPLMGDIERAAASLPEARPADLRVELAVIDIEALRRSADFDRDFVSTLVRQRQAGIMLARMQQAYGADARLKAAAGEIRALYESQLPRLRALQP